MEVRSLSATAIKDFLQCQLKLVFRYDRSTPSVKNDHARLGIAVHEALDQFTRRMTSKRSFPDKTDLDYAVSVFMNKATEEGLESLGFYKQGRDIVSGYVSRFDFAEKVLEVEHRFKIETPEGVPIAGAIDKVVEINEDTIAIVDYKTARNALTPYELDDDIQLSMYDLAASLIWPQYANRILCLDYVRIDKRVTTVRSDKDRQAFREFLHSIWLQISKLPESEIRGKINKLCGWCDYRDRCPQYADLITEKKLALTPLTDLTDDEFIEQWEQVSAFKSIIDSRQRELKMAVHDKFMLGETIRGTGREISSSQQSRTSYDMDQVIKLIPRENLFGLLTVNKAKLDGYARDDADLRNRLNRIAQVSYNAPIYRVRTFKEDGSLDVARELPDADEDESAA